MRAYALAVLLVAASLAVRSFLEPWLGERVPYLQFFPAILVAAWYGGFGPGALATALAVLSAMAFVLPPAGLGVGNASDVLSLALFGGTGCGIAWLTHRWRAAAALAVARTAQLDATVAALRASEQQYRALFAGSPVAMALTKMPEATTVDVNDAFLTLFQFSRGEVIGRPSVDLGISDAAAHADVRARVSRDGFVRNFECTRRTRSGETRTLVLDIVPVDIGGISHVLTTIRDVTAQRRAEQTLVEQASLARLGEMMTTIAHEVRNPLAGIRTTLQIVGDSLPEDGPERAAARDAIVHVDALKDLVQDMLTVARPRPPRVGPLEIRPLLERTVEFARADSIAAHVAVALEGDAPPVGGDAHQLTRAFLNLLRNAAQAMDGRGRIDIRIRAAERDCVVSVKDSGPGMPPDVRTRLFQPFFTTKPSGTGLGLATVKQTIELHGGSIAADSEPGRGATFTVTLPIWQSTDAAQPSVSAARAREGDVV